MAIDIENLRARARADQAKYREKNREKLRQKARDDRAKDPNINERYNARRREARAANPPLNFMPTGHQLKGLSTLVGPDGETKAQWIKTFNHPDPEETCRIIKEAFENYERPDILGNTSIIPGGPGLSSRTDTPPPRDIRESDRNSDGSYHSSLLSLYCLPDLHIGQYCWASEVDVDWDLKTARQVITSTFARLVNMTLPSELAVILGGGDQLHADSNEEKTRRGGHKQQVDDRYDKVLGVACQIFVDNIDLCLHNHKNVEVRILKGNHDEHASTALSYFLQAWYRNEGRVTVDVSPSLFYWKRYGSVFLAATHGHEAGPKQMAGIMAARRPEDWGLTKYRYAHTFHVHHVSKFVSEEGGCIVETHQTPAPQDTYNYGAGFLAGRSLQSIVYDRELGEKARSKVVV
jgi:hypothetical protein